MSEPAGIEKPTKVPIDEYFVAGKMHRPKDDWCEICFKPSLWEGPLYHLTCTGVSPWGRVTFCFTCKNGTKYPDDPEKKPSKLLVDRDLRSDDDPKT